MLVGIVGVLKNYKYVPEIIDPLKLSQAQEASQAPLQQPIHAPDALLPNLPSPQIPDIPVEIY